MEYLDGSAEEDMKKYDVIKVFVCCSVLQCVAVCCSVLQCAVQCVGMKKYDVIKVSVCCGVL